MRHLFAAVLAMMFATTALAVSQVAVTGQDPSGTPANYLPAKVKNGSLQVQVFPSQTMWSYSVISTATVLTEAKAASAAGYSYYITDINVSAVAASTAAADGQLNIYYGTGTACATGTTLAYSCIQAATDGCSVKLQTPIKIPAAKAICFIGAVVGTKSVNLSGFLAP